MFARIERRSVLRVLHVLPTDLTRGAQRYARAVADRANLVGGQNHELAVLFAGPRLTARAEHDLDVPSGWLRSAGFDTRAARRLRALVRRSDPHVVVAHGAEAMKYAAFLPRSGPLVVCHAIGVSSPKATRDPLRTAYRALYRRADLVTAVSTAVADELIAVFALDPGSVLVLPNARDPQEFHGPTTTAGDGIFRLLFVGHMTPTKRPDTFLDVVEAVRLAGHPVEAVMIGDGPLRDRVTERAERMHVEVLGPRDDVPAQLARGSALVFTSVAEGEGMPGVLIEAALAGLPVVSTDVPGARDVVRPGETGEIVPVEDVAAMAAAVVRLVGDRGLRDRMAAAARTHARGHFSLAENVAEWNRLLEGLAARRVNAGSATHGKQRDQQAGGSEHEQQDREHGG